MPITGWCIISPGQHLRMITGTPVIDIGFRCDDKQCGMGATYLFKQVNGKWIVAGRKSLWSS